MSVNSLLGKILAEKFSSVPSLNGVTCDGVGGVDQAMAALKHYHNKNYPGLSCFTDNVPS